MTFQDKDQFGIRALAAQFRAHPESIRRIIHSRYLDAEMKAARQHFLDAEASNEQSGGMLSADAVMTIARRLEHTTLRQDTPNPKEVKSENVPTRTKNKRYL